MMQNNIRKHKYSYLKIMSNNGKIIKTIKRKKEKNMVVDNNRLKKSVTPKSNDDILKNIESISNMSISELYQTCGIGKSMPISFDRLTKTFKINIIGTDFSYISNLPNVKKLIGNRGDILGMVSIQDQYANIYYNNNPSVDIPKQRFVIAHELAHCVNHYNALSESGHFEFSKKLNLNNEGVMANSTNEQICDKFARDFLIPSDSLIRVYGIVDEPKVKHLANLFLVPEEEMKKKLEELGL